MMRRTLTATATATCGALIVMLVGAGVAWGGSYTVASCQADKLNYSSTAFTGFSWRWMLEPQRECNPEGRGMRGLIIGNAVRRGTVPWGSESQVRITAPPGTSIRSFRWGGQIRRRDCRWGLEIYAKLGYEPRSPAQYLGGLQANRTCARNSLDRLDAPGFKKLFEKSSIPIHDAVVIVQRVICQARSGRKVCPTNRKNFIRTFSAEVEVVDEQAPTASIIPDTPLAMGAWVSGSQPLHYEAQDNVGVQLGRAIVAGEDGGRHSRSCRMATPEGAFADAAPCPNGPGEIPVATAKLLDGAHQLVVQAQDTAGNVGTSAVVTARIDNTAPPRIDASVDGGEQWRNRNDYSVSWDNPPELDRAPIVAATGKLCRVDGGGCSELENAAADVSGLPVQVPAPGEWTVAVWRRDAAGNQDPRLASVPVTLRYDPEPPQLGFEPPTATDPTAVSVQVTDPISGLADGSIEISRAGSDTWQTLARQKDAGRLTARIDDAALPAGTYLLRATARDQAGNEASTTQRVDGQQMAVTLPLRIPTVMRVGIQGKRTVRRVVRLRGKRRTIRRRVTVMLPAASVVFGRNVQVRGRLTTPDRRGIAGADMQVLSRTDATAEQLVGTVRTDAAGNYTYNAAGSASRVLRFAYAGTPLTLPAHGEVRLRVPAASTLRVNRPRVVNGQSVRFGGRVRTLPVPASGKLVELQVLLTGRWQTFRTGRTDQAGRWRLSYRFARTRADQRFLFRVRLPREAGYPFGGGGSRPVSVLVRGR